MTEDILPILLAPFIGSFLGVLVMRLPTGRPVLWARSACDSCEQPLTALDLVPLLSWLVLRGRCRHCGSPIDRLHPTVELVATAVAACAVLAGGPVWANCVLGWVLLVLGWIDARHMRLPDVLTLPLLVAGLAEVWLRAPDRLADHAFGAILGYFAFRTVAAVYRALRGREGLGAGDAKLLAAGGAWLGWDQLSSVVFIAALCGILWLLVKKGGGGGLSRNTKLAFGAFLSLAIWLIRLVDAGGMWVG